MRDRMNCPKCDGTLIHIGTCYNSDPVKDQYKCGKCGRLITITQTRVYE